MLENGGEQTLQGPGDLPVDQRATRKVSSLTTHLSYPAPSVISLAQAAAIPDQRDWEVRGSSFLGAASRGRENCREQGPKVIWE